MIIAVSTTDNEIFEVGEDVTVLGGSVEVKVIECLKPDDYSTIKITTVGKDENGDKCIFRLILKNISMVIEKEVIPEEKINKK